MGLLESLNLIDPDLALEILREKSHSRVITNSQSHIYNSLYQKLGHPVESLIKTLSHMWMVLSLIAFIKISLIIIKKYPDITSNINTVLMPYTQGPLNSCLLRHINFANFHKETLKVKFLGPRTVLSSARTWGNTVKILSRLVPNFT